MPSTRALLLAAAAVVACGALELVAAQQSQVEQSGVVQSRVSAPIPSDGGVSVVSEDSTPVLYHLRFFSAFLASISMIIVSEFGDKTFFIAAIMSMRHNRAEVFASAIAALALMTVLSAGMGLTLPAMLDPKITHYMATALFFFFGAKLLYDAYGMDGSADLKEELEEVEEELKTKELEESVGLGAGVVSAGHKDAGIEMAGGVAGNSSGGASKLTRSSRGFLDTCHMFFRRFFSRVFLTCFSMTFLAEWGDRSQIATIALAAQKDALGVTAGGIVGHALCTGVAVLGGKLLATRISERTISLTGGALFLIFGIHSLYFGEEH